MKFIIKNTSLLLDKLYPEGTEAKFDPENENVKKLINSGILVPAVENENTGKNKKTGFSKSTKNK